MIEAEKNFSQSLLDGKKPELAGYGDEGASLLSIFKKNEGEVRNDELAPIFEQLDTIKEGMKALEEEKDALTSRLKEAIGDKRILHAGNWRGTWSKFEVARIDVDRLREEKPAIAEEYTKKTPSSTFRITKE
jgi:predicted phage-related endonuclease